MFPNGFPEKMRRLLGDEYEAFLASYDSSRNVGLRRNPLRGEVQLPDFGLTSVPWCQSGYYYDPATRPGLHPYHEAGAYYLQEPSAMAPAELLDPRPGERVLDLCAAPGGKATQLAGKMMGEGLLVMNEYSASRAKILSRNAERLGVTNALVLNETPQRLAERFAGWFDRVLVDAPCSGEGMFRKEADAVTDWSEDTVAMCAARQDEVLACAGAMVRPGGRLCYSTCTFSPEENEGVIARFLANNPDFKVEKVSAPHFAPGHPEWADGNADLAHTFRLWPHKLRGEGHYAAVLTRIGGEENAPASLKAAKLPADCAAFLKEHFDALPEGLPVLFGETVYLAPAETPDLTGLKVLRAGLELGKCLRGRFEPAHALALAVKPKQCLFFPADAPEIARYLRGETIPCDRNGWITVCADGLALGWGKASNGQLKNHFPKALRWVSEPVFP